MAKTKQEFDLAPLILKVKENPILFDKNHEDYGDQIKTNRAWNGIARELLLPNGEVVRCKWKSTCEIYLKQLKGSKKNASGKWPWAEHMKFFEPYLIEGKTVEEQTKNQDKPTSTPTKKTAPTKRQRSPVEVATTGRRVSRSVASLEEEHEVDSPAKKSRISVLEESVERKVTSAKGTPKKSGTMPRRLPRSAVRAMESQDSIIEEDSDINETVNVSPSKNASRIIPIEISPDMRKGPRRLPRSVLKALEAQVSSTSDSSQHAPSSAPSRAKDDMSLLNQTLSRSSTITTKRSQRMSLDPKLTPNFVRPLPKSSTRYSHAFVPEESSIEGISEISGLKDRFSSSRSFSTDVSPGKNRDTQGYFQFGGGGRPNDDDDDDADDDEDQMMESATSKERSFFQSPARRTISSLTSSSCRLPRSAALEEEFARHDAMMNRNLSLLEPNSFDSTASDDTGLNGRDLRRLPVTSRTKEDMDATDLLFLSHALTIKSFSERKQVEVKRKIAQIIAQAEIEEVG